MKALRNATLITLAMLVCGAFSLWGLPRILSQYGLEYRDWLEIIVFLITFLSAIVLGVLLWVIFAKLYNDTDREDTKAIVNVLALFYTPVCLLAAILIVPFFCISITVGGEWVEVENGAKYVVVRGGGDIETRYPYANIFVHGSDGTIIYSQD